MKVYKLLFYVKFLTIISLGLKAGDKMMHVKQNNFNAFFIAAERNITSELILFTPEKYRSHPEFGILPFNAQCEDCIELIQKRTEYSRYFIKTGSNGKHFFEQRSLFPLHLKNNKGEWITIDERLQKISADILSAPCQQFPTSYNLSAHTTSITSTKFTLTFNKNLKSYWLSEKGNIKGESTADKKKFTAGFEGVRILQAWNKTNIEHIYKPNSIKTNYIIQQSLNIPDDVKWLVFEDAIQLPQNFLFRKSENDLVILNERNEEIIIFHQPQYYDGYSYGMSGEYEISQQGNVWFIKVLVPVSLLNDSKIHYPLTIDPWVTAGPQGIGEFAVPFPATFNSANMGFTFGPNGSCDYDITFIGLGGATLINTYLDVEYENKFNPCNSTSQPPYCEFSDVSMEVIGPCGTSTGQLICNPAQPPFNGTCTTDPLKVPAARAILIPNFLNCIEPQCPDYELTFTIKNREFKCNDNCARNCATGHRFAVTLEGRTIEERVTISDDVVCAGETVFVTSLPLYGVKPYTYLWNPTGQTDSIITVNPEVSSAYACVVTDLCGNFAEADTFITVTPSPDADAGGTFTTCEGVDVQIGGNPTSTNGFTFQWTAIPSFASVFLSDLNIANPVVFSPSDSIRSYTFVVRVEDATCFRYDTTTVIFLENPEPSIIPDQTIFICEGGSSVLQTDTIYETYSWSTGVTTSTITITQPGSYAVTVTNQGCRGFSQPVTAQLKPILVFDVLPQDTSFNEGGSVTLRTNINLNDPAIQNYYWEPNNEISCVNCTNPIATPSADRHYYLYVEQDGCISVDSAFVNIIYPNKYVIPSAFTPNKDGKNDKFYIIKQSGVTVREFKVFNRWGELVHDAVFPWDGTYKDELQDMEVFTYYFKLEFSDGSSEIAKGNVTLIR
jgi:gliding motility-associated-like protein